MVQQDRNSNLPDNKVNVQLLGGSLLIEGRGIKWKSSVPLCYRMEHKFKQVYGHWGVVKMTKCLLLAIISFIVEKS